MLKAQTENELHLGFIKLNMQPESMSHVKKTTKLRGYNFFHTFQNLHKPNYEINICGRVQIGTLLRYRETSSATEIDVVGELCNEDNFPMLFDILEKLAHEMHSVKNYFRSC